MLPFLKIGPFQIILLLIIIGIFLIPMILYLIKIQNLIKKIDLEHRKIQPNQVWYILIPIFGLVWQFIMIEKLNNSLKLELSKRNINYNLSQTYNFGLIYCILFIGTIIPIIGFILAIGGFISWLIYWIKISEINNLLKNNDDIKSIGT